MRGFATAVYVTVILMGFTGSVTFRPDDAAIPPLPSDLEAVQYPLDAFRNDDERQGLIEYSWNIVVARCLERFGFSVAIGEPVALARVPAAQRYGLVDLSVAGTHGYTRQPVPQPPKPLAARLPDAARTVFYGTGTREYNGLPVPAGGCSEEARLKVIPDANPLFISELESTARKRQRVGKRFQQLMSTWRSCVHQAGYSYDNPGDPFRYWDSRRRPGTPPSTEETGAALADVRCKLDTGVLAAWVALEIRYQRQVVSENEKLLNLYRKTMASAAERARRIRGQG